MNMTPSSLKNSKSEESKKPKLNNRPSSGSMFNRWLVLVLGVLLLIGIFQLISAGILSNTYPTDQLTYSEFYQQIMNKNVHDATFSGQTDISGSFVHPVKTANQTYMHYHVYQIPNDDPHLQLLLTQNGAVVINQAPPNSSLWINLAIDYLPWIGLLILLYFIIRRASQGQQGIFSFGKSRAKLVVENKPGTTFADVAGVDEAKYELEEVVEFLKTPEKFQRLGGRIPRGVLLVGPPGTGKTLLARAVAGEAEVPFFSMSGSEFVEVLVGVGASRVRDLFEQAKKAAPCIIFIDEIDAVGRQRGSSINSNDEREQTLNQLLVEMDGFDTRQAVVVLAATNRPDGLDKALLRPGRFDRRVTVDRPDWNGRLAILKIHTKQIPLGPDVDLGVIARATTGMVGADLANVVNEAALLAARRNLEVVTQSCIEEALDKVVMGAERPLVLSEQDLQVVAYHESGHALTGLLQQHADPVNKVTIVPRGHALGVTISLPLDDRYNYSQEYLLTQLVVALGGRAAEEVAIGSITTGAQNDFEKVTSITQQMVTKWGMDEKIGIVAFAERDDPFAGTPFANTKRVYSDKTAKLIDEEVKAIVSRAYTRAVELLRTHKGTLDRMAHALRVYETIDAKQLRKILEETGAIKDTPLAYQEVTAA